MTNQEIIIEIPLPCELNTADLNRVMNKAREDERNKVLDELLEWGKIYLNISNISFNAVIQDTKKAGGDEVRKLVRNKLNAMRNGNEKI